MKIVKKVRVTPIVEGLSFKVSINLIDIADEFKLYREEDGWVVELVISGEPLEEPKEEKKSKPRAWGKGELKWEPVEDPRYKEDTIKLTYLSNGKYVWSRYISKKQLDELYNKLPEKARMDEVFKLANDVGLSGLRGLGSHFLRFLTQLYPDLKLEKIGKKGGGYFYQLVKEKKAEEKSFVDTYKENLEEEREEPEEEVKKEEKVEYKEELGENSYYKDLGNIVEIRCGPEIITPTWEQLKEIFDRLPEKASIYNIRNAYIEVVGDVIGLETALALAKFFDRRAEFDAELRPERGVMVLVKGAESERYGEDLKAKLKLEKDLFKDFEQ